nr:DNA-3-methyladenine glycosylase II [Cryptococcus depauperatus CBS 7855]
MSPRTRSKAAKTSKDMAPSNGATNRAVVAALKRSKVGKPTIRLAKRDQLDSKTKKTTIEPISAGTISASLKETIIPTSIPSLPPILSFDLSAAYAHLSALDPRFSMLFKHLPCRPFVNLESIDPFRTLVTSIIGQQVSWMAARAINSRFRALFGFADEKDGFPSPDMILKHDVASLRTVGLSGRKAEYVLSLAEHFTTGLLSADLFTNGTDEEIAKSLIAVRGIGQWTVDMFMIFSLRRPDILAVGDLGVQKGLLKWALAAHGALEKKSSSSSPRKNKSKGKKEVMVEKVDEAGEGEVDTSVKKSTPLRPSLSSSQYPTPASLEKPVEQSYTAVLHTPATPSRLILSTPSTSAVPSNTPDEVAEVPPKTLPTLTPAAILDAPLEHLGWEPHRAVPLTDGLTVEVLKARLNGKKVKGGAYLTPQEMQVLTEPWRPFRSLGVFYMWPIAGES